MEITFEFWYIFPLSILFATLSMASGIGSPVFFSPLFIVILNFEPKIAVGTALLTQLFGLSSGFIAYAKARLIDYRLGMTLLIFSLPMAFIGSFVGKVIPADLLKGIFALGIIFIAYQLYKSWKVDQKNDDDSEDNHSRYHYEISNKNLGRFLAALGGMFLGMISVGLAELQSYYLIAKCKVTPAIAVATIIFVLASTVFLASLGHLYQFTFESEISTINRVINVVAFSIPGVVIGGQIGPRLQHYLPNKTMKIAIAALFAVIGLFMLLTLIIV